MKKRKSNLKVVKNCGGKRGRGCSSAFEWNTTDSIKPVEMKKAA